jgi:hypothetical protein
MNTTAKRLVLEISSMLALAVGAHADQATYRLFLSRTAKDTYITLPSEGNPTQMIVVTKNCNQMAIASEGTLYWDNANDTGVFVWYVLDWSFERAKALGQDSKYIETGRCNVVEVRPLGREPQKAGAQAADTSVPSPVPSTSSYGTSGWILSDCARPKGDMTDMFYCTGLYNGALAALEASEDMINTARDQVHTPHLCVRTNPPTYDQMLANLAKRIHDRPEWATAPGSFGIVMALLDSGNCQVAGK